MDELSPKARVWLKWADSDATKPPGAPCDSTALELCRYALSGHDSALGAAFWVAVPNSRVERAISCALHAHQTQRELPTYDELLEDIWTS